MLELFVHFLSDPKVVLRNDIHFLDGGIVLLKRDVEPAMGSGFSRWVCRSRRKRSEPRFEKQGKNAKCT